MRVSPAARRRLDHLVQGREEAPQALWVRVEGSHVVPGAVSLALVDRPDPLPEGYRLQLGWTVPILVDEAHVDALRGARVEYDPGSSAFRVRPAGELERPARPGAAPETGCTSCPSASLPEMEALRASLGRLEPGEPPGAIASGAVGRGPALPVVGQLDPFAEVGP